MNFYLFSAVLIIISAICFWLGKKFSSTRSIADLEAKNMNPLLARRLRIITLVMGERWGTVWIKSMGVLLIIVSAALLITAAYIAIFKPEQIFA